MLYCIPLCGLGQRFAAAGFREPKPFLRLGGKTLVERVVESIGLAADDELVLIAPASYRHRGLERLTRADNVVYLYSPTDGALATLYHGLAWWVCHQRREPRLLTQRLVCLDADTFYGVPLGDLLRGALRANAAAEADAAVVVFEERSGRACFSFAGIDAAAEPPTVSAVAEKQRISDWALSGVYAFRSASFFLEHASLQLAQRAPNERGECHVSGLVDALARARRGGVAPICVHHDDVRCAGTPEQWVEVAGRVEGAPMRVCFDLDNTLVTAPRVPGDYATVQPIERVIAYARQLKAAGHTIVLHTARRMRTHGGNAGRAVADVAAVTFKTLDALRIPYDEVHFGKPHADVYIDDLAVTAQEVLPKALGVFDALGEAHAPRGFNRVDATEDTVTKSSSTHMQKIRAEAAWYRSVPPDLAPWFPTLLDATPTSYTMTRVRQPTFSWLFVHELLTPAMLTRALAQLRDIHRRTDAADPACPLLYNNYLPKWRQRPRHPSVSEHQAQLVERFMADYQLAARAVPARVHGDPVFTNIFWDGGLQQAVFIDMGGMQCDVQTTDGDALYDYAKVLQSLCGYDEVLAQQPVSFAYKLPLLRAFWTFVEGVAPGRQADVERIKDCLVLSLLPLHDADTARALFNTYA